MIRISRRALLGLATTTGLAAFTVGLGLPSAHAAAGCSVTYSVTSQWNAGFGAQVSVTNLGDAVGSWSLTWSFPGSQQVTQAWNAAVTQSGSQVTARNASWNGSLATTGSASFGFNGSYSGSNPAPTSFALNGTTCTGSATASASPTRTSAPSPTPGSPAPSSAGPTATGDPWNPPGSLVAPLAQVWQHEESTYTNLYGFKNYGWDQVMANRGSINYCVRWDSSSPVSATLRDQIQAALGRQFKKWMDQMVEGGRGWNAWPYAEVPVKVVGWAVRDRNTLQWTDNSVDIYVNDINENAPQCAPPCGRFFHQDNNYSGCPGGAAHHYDMSLWLTAGFGGGAGGDWGQRVGSEYFVGALNSDNIHIVLHEMGHTFGLDDFYDWIPSGVGGFIMNAGSATQITEFDKWMLRDFWRHLKSRYGL